MCLEECNKEEKTRSEEIINQLAKDNRILKKGVAIQNKRSEEALQKAA